MSQPEQNATIDATLPAAPADPVAESSVTMPPSAPDAADGVAQAAAAELAPSQTTQLLSQSATASSPEPMPLTQELPPPTQSTDASASQTVDSVALSSLPPSQVTQPINPSPDSTNTLTQTTSEADNSAEANGLISSSATVAVAEPAKVDDAFAGELAQVAQPEQVLVPAADAPAADAIKSEPVADVAPVTAAPEFASGLPASAAPPDAEPLPAASAEAAAAPLTTLVNGTAASTAPHVDAAPLDLGAAPAPASSSAPVAVPASLPPPARLAQAAATRPRAPPGLVQMSTAQIKFAQNAIRSLKVRSEARWFLDPVDPIALNIPSYALIVKEPMDLGTIDFKLSLTSYNRTAQASGNPAPRPSEKVRMAMARNLDPARDYYATVDDFVRDVILVFDNCARFNGEEHQIAKQGRELQQVFEKQMKSIPAAEAEPVKSAAAMPAPPKPRTSSASAMPIARRTSSTDANGRPKREIIPPPSKDLPWDDTSHASQSIAGPSIAKKRRRTTLTPREQAYYARINSEDLKFAQKVVDELYKPAHQNIAWVFYDLPDTTLDFAPAYYEMIKQPVSMRKIAMKLKAGEFSDLADFDAAWQLLFRNCFTFNPPDTDVYVMGKKLKDAYEDKMKKRPIHPPLSPDPLDDVEMVDADGEESRLADIEAQIAKLRAEAATLKKDVKPVKTKAAPLASAPSSKKAKTSTAKAAASTALAPPALSPTEVEATVPKPAKKKASKPKDANGSSSGASKKKGGAGGAPSPARRASSGAAGGSNGASKKQRRESQPAKPVETFQEITYPQKEELAIKIQELPEDRLDGALSIIAEDKPPSAGDQDEIELDIDAISPKTLYKLYTYVVGPLPVVGTSAGTSANGAAGAGAADGQGNGGSSKKKKNAKKSKPASGAGAADGRKRGTGGLKRKNLDEEEEAQRIASLRQQLNQFNGGDTSASGSASALPVDAGHDDLVHSDSSSGDDSGSDSESDFD
ncbi:hypothetical protein V8E36_006180 [Tilletia maclaganii]